MKTLNFFTSFNSNSVYHLSWNRYADNIFAIQDFNEEINPIFAKTIKSSSVSFHGKNTHAISEIAKLARTYSDTFVLINSDIEIAENDYLWEKILDASKHGIVIGNRYNYEEDWQSAQLNLNGIDFFVINSSLNIPDNNYFHMGICYWDWWIPFLAIEQNVDLFKINEPFLYHKIHKRNWTQSSYIEMKKYFLELTKFPDNDSYKKEIMNGAKNII